MPNWWVTDIIEGAGPVYLGSWIFWVIFSITLHELSHGWAAIREGDDTPIATGHMTWNPIVHMGPVSLVMLALMGFCWGAMPVDPTRFRSRHGNAIVSAAGPAMNLALGLVSAVLYVLWARFGHGVGDPNVHHNVGLFLYIGVGLNLFSVLFNLVPVPPLDGWRIASDILPRFVPRARSFFGGEKGAIIAAVAFLLLFNVFSVHIWQMSATLSHAVIKAVTAMLGG